MRPHQVRPFSGHRQWPRHSLSARCFRTVDRSGERHNGRSEYGSNRSGHLTVPVYRGRSECETNRPEASDHLLTVGMVGRFSLRPPLAQSLLKGIQYEVGMSR